MTTRVVNIRLFPWKLDPSSYVYMGRSGQGVTGLFGNPFSVANHGVAALKKFREYFLKRVREDADFYKAVMALEGKTLGCFCVDEDGNGPCHAKVVADFITDEVKRLTDATPAPTGPGAPPSA